jgi:hypothetical protein
MIEMFVFLYIQARQDLIVKLRTYIYRYMVVPGSVGSSG